MQIELAKSSFVLKGGVFIFAKEEILFFINKFR